VNNDDYRERRKEHAEAETSQGTKRTFGLFPVYAVLAALMVVLYLFIPAHWVALSMVIIALATAGVILARGRDGTRRRG
jgi:VIT1/CCC1 family predicted Fe2+/Mn2+ transporter